MTWGSSYSLMSWKRNMVHTQITHTITHSPHHVLCRTPLHILGHTHASSHACLITRSHTFSHSIFIHGILCLYCGKCCSFKHAGPQNAGSKFISCAICTLIILIFLKEDKICVSEKLYDQLRSQKCLCVLSEMCTSIMGSCCTENIKLFSNLQCGFTDKDKVCLNECPPFCCLNHWLHL